MKVKVGYVGYHTTEVEIDEKYADPDVDYREVEQAVLKAMHDEDDNVFEVTRVDRADTGECIYEL